MRQVSIAALYGRKPTSFAYHIIAMQDMLSDLLGDEYHRYRIEQVHSTIISLEQSSEGFLYNRYWTKGERQAQPMNLAGLLHRIREMMFPLVVQIGGFQDIDYPFTSWGERPYQRSFNITPSGNMAVVIGWPVGFIGSVTEQPDTSLRANVAYPNTLAQLRREVEAFNIVHRYHRSLLDYDNDFYFRIGLIDPPLNPKRNLDTARTMRNFLSKMEPLMLEIALEDLYLITGEDETVPPESTQAYSLADSTITPEFICSLYQ